MTTHRPLSNSLPKVSICIPTYNHAQFLGDAIRSVLSQTFTDYELIVIDNCSTDDTQAVVAQYLLRDTRCKYICNERNIGLGGNLNRCLELASGKYIKILLADDFLEPTCLEKSVQALDDHPNAAMLTCARLITDQQFRPLTVAAYSKKSAVIIGRKAIKNCFFKGNLIGEPTAVIFRKEFIRRGFNLKYKQVIDLEMWFYLLEQGDLVFLSEILCRFRQHEHQGTLKNAQEFAAVDDELMLYNDYIHKEYIGDTFLNKQKWKIKLAGIIWYHKQIGVDPVRVNAKIKEYYSLSFFLTLHFILLTYRFLVNMLAKPFSRKSKPNG